MQILLNGKDKEISNGHTVKTLIEELGYQVDYIVAELNEEVVSREKFGEVNINENDKLELLQFVGGGK